jgi:hypothetical protein
MLPERESYRCLVRPSNNHEPGGQADDGATDTMVTDDRFGMLGERFTEGISILVHDRASPVGSRRDRRIA